MKKKQITFIIPGFRHKTTQKAYKKIATILKKEGHTPVPVNIPWNQRTITENTAYFIDKYEKKIPKKTSKKTAKITVLGFSFGAMIAFLASTKIKVDNLILCSLSPYFKEDLPKAKPSLRSKVEKKRYEDFSKIQCKKVVKKTKAKNIMMLYGSKESRLLIKRVVKAYKQLHKNHKYLVPIYHTEHDISDRNYLKTIQQLTTEFL